MSDLISREALIEEFKKWLPKEGSEWLESDIHPLENLSVSAIITIEEAPTVEAKPVVHGKWEECDWVEYDGHVACSRYPKGALRCSECHNAFKKELLWKNNFCPNCGADMRKKVQE